MIVRHDDAGAALRRLAIPIATTLVADQLLGIADTIVVGSLGLGPLAAISAASSIFMTVAIALFAFGSGPRIMGSQAIGAGDLPRFGAIVRASLVAPLVVSALAIVAAAVGGHALLSAMIPHVAEAGEGATYLTLRATSLLAMMLTGIVVTAFGASGDTTLGPRTLVAINVVHIPLLVVFALGIGTHHPLGLVGAGIASLCSEIVGAWYCLRAAWRRPTLQIFAAARIDPALVRATAKLALPEFVFLVFLIVPEPITLALLAPAGVAAVDAFRALTIVSDLTWALPGSLGESMEIVIGQRIGARDIPAARIFGRRAMRAGVAVCGAVALAVAACAWPLAALVTLDPAVATLAAAPLAVHALLLPVKGYAMSALAPIRASGDVRFTMLVGIFTSLLALAGIVAGLEWLRIGLWSVPLGWSIAWSVRSWLTLRRLQTGDWETRELAA